MCYAMLAIYTVGKNKKISATWLAFISQLGIVK